MPINKTQNLTPFVRIYKGMKIIITKTYVPKLLMKTIGYVESVSFTKSHWIQHDNLMHPPINILINFNEFKQKYETLQDITLRGLL
jgi:hypothetical protein